MSAPSGQDTGVATFNATAADSLCGPIEAANEQGFLYVAPNSTSPVTFQSSPDNTTWYDNLDFVNGSASTGKYGATTGVLPFRAAIGSYYRLNAKNADFVSGTTGTGRIWFGYRAC